MIDSGDFAVMSDPDFLAERTRVREELQELTERCAPELLNSAGRCLDARRRRLVGRGAPQSSNLRHFGLARLLVSWRLSTSNHDHDLRGFQARQKS